MTQSNKPISPWRQRMLQDMTMRKFKPSTQRNYLRSVELFTGEQKRNFRLTHSQPVVDQLFAWFDQQRQRPELLPSNPFSKAVAYMQAREHALRVFLDDPAVPMDNNHTERALRVIPMGRKSWILWWTELGAEHEGIIQSLIVTCKMQGIDPAIYLVDFLQRVAIHPPSKVEELTPRRWKDLFAQNPLRSDLCHEH